jgi:hypothetical protein
MITANAKVEDFVVRKAGNYLFLLGITAESELLDKGYICLRAFDIQ